MLRQFKRCLSLYVNCKVELSIDFLQNYLHSLHAVMLVRPGWSVSSVWGSDGWGSVAATWSWMYLQLCRYVQLHL